MPAMFTQRHFIALAALLKDAKPRVSKDSSPDRYLGEIGQWEKTVESLAEFFVVDNPKFKKKLFLKASDFSK